MKSEQINELASALNKAQAELQSAKKDANNPFFKSKYADLTSVWEAARPVLAKNGLSVAQTVGLTGLTTILMHSSGQYIEDTMPIVVAKQNDPQALGSAITYARRYALAAIVGVVADDDDGNAAAAKPAAVNSEVFSVNHTQKLITAVGDRLNALDPDKKSKAFEKLTTALTGKPLSDLNHETDRLLKSWKL